ncbi:Hypothetical predicted protein, partial [Mytilus galloprovincialis]
LYGDYESLTNGEAIDTLVDFTGGVAERINLIIIKDEKTRKVLFGKLKEDCENEALIICYIQVKPGDKRGKELPQGFVLGHGYSITAVKDILQGNTKLLMIKLANPWGKMEWNGPWSETSSEWQKMGPILEAELPISKDKGEFWMTFDDFLNHLTNVDICHIVKPSNEFILHSEWTGRSGGCDYKTQSFLSNRQFIIEIQQDEDELVVSLEQHDIKPSESHTERTLNTIGYSIMKVFNSNKIIDDFCCQARVTDNGGEESKSVKCDVFGKKKEKYTQKPGYIHVLVQSSHDLQFL